MTTNEKLDTYLNLCTQFYDLGKPDPPADAYAFYLSYVRNATGPILEPMCGTGRFLLPLVAAGFAIDGFDASEHMLEALADKANKLHVKPHVWKEFLQDLQTPVKYKLIFIPAGSFGLIEDLPTAKSALAALYDHLADDGMLLFEGETIHAVPKSFNVLEKHELVRSDGKKIVASFNRVSLQNDVCTMNARYELIDDDKIINTEEETYKIRLYEPEQMMAMLNSVGFVNVKMIKAFDKDKIPAENDEVIVYECVKLLNPKSGSL